MNTNSELSKRLLDSSQWPDLFRPEFMNELNLFADKAFKKKSIEGSIAGLLIYHQLCEEMVRSLIRISTFFVQCALMPIEYKDREVDRKMFGQLLDELDRGPKVKETDEFISKCKELNDIRIKIVHKITRKTSLEEIKEVCAKSKILFDEIFELFDYIYDQWRLGLKDVKKDYEANLESEVE